MTRSGMEGVPLERRVSPVLVGCEESQTITKARPRALTPIPTPSHFGTRKRGRNDGVAAD